MTVTIYHNPRCGKSRQALELLRGHGIEPHIVEYLKTPPDAAALRRLLGLLGLKPRQLMRPKESAAAGLTDATLDDDALIAGMVTHPITIERPIVVKEDIINGDKAVLGRPPEKVLEIL